MCLRLLAGAPAQCDLVQSVHGSIGRTRTERLQGHQTEQVHVLARDDLPCLNARALPCGRCAVAAAVLFADHHEVVFFAGCEGNRRGFLQSSRATGRAVKVPSIGPARHLADQRCIDRTGVGTQPELLDVVAGDPEGVVSGLWRLEPAPESLAVVVAPVHRAVDRIDVLGVIRIVRIPGVSGQAAGESAVDAQPVFVLDLVGGTVGVLDGEAPYIARHNVGRRDRVHAPVVGRGGPQPTCVEFRLLEAAPIRRGIALRDSGRILAEIQMLAGRVSARHPGENQAGRKIGFAVGRIRLERVQRQRLEAPDAAGADHSAVGVDFVDPPVICHAILQLADEMPIEGDTSDIGRVRVGPKVYVVRRGHESRRPLNHRHCDADLAVGRDGIRGLEQRLGVPNPGGQVLACDDDRAGADSRAAPGDADGPSARAVLHEGLDVIPLAGLQRNRCGFEVCTRRTGRAREVLVVHPTVDAADLDFVGRVFIRAQPDDAVVVAGDPERVIAGLRRVQIAAAAAPPVILSAVGTVPRGRPVALMRTVRVVCERL